MVCSCMQTKLIHHVLATKACFLDSPTSVLHELGKDEEILMRLQFSSQCSLTIESGTVTVE